MRYRSIALGVITITHGWDDFLFIVLAPLLPLLILEFGLNYLEAGIIIFIFRASTAILQPFTGYLGDRTGRMKMLLVIGILGFSLGLFAAGTTSSYMLLLMAVFIAGIGASMYHPIGVTLLGRVFGKEKLGFVLGVHGAGGGFGVFIAPVVAAFFANLFGWRHFLMALIIPSSIIAMLIILFLQDLKDKMEVKISFRGIWTFGVASVAIISFFTSMCFTIMTTFVPIFLVDIEGLDIVTTGLFTSIMLSAMIYSQPIIGRIYDRFDQFKKEILIILLLGWGITWFLFTITSIPLKIFFVTMASFCISATWPILFDLMLRMAPKGKVATTIGMVEGVTMLGGISSVIFGRAADMYGLNLSLPFAAFITCSAAILSYFLPKKFLRPM